MDEEDEIKKQLLDKWKRFDYQSEKMAEIVRKNGLSSVDNISDKMKRSIGVKRVIVEGNHYKYINNDCIWELEQMPDNSVDEIVTSIPFGNHYEYTPSYNDLGHNEDNDRFFEQMDYLTPNLLRVLKPGWTEQCKDGSKMGVGCPEYVLLFRKLPTDTSKAYADTPVTKSKADYSRGRWQIDAHAYWRSSGDRLVTKEVSVNKLQKVYTQFSKSNVYNYDEHVALAEKLDKENKLPASFMVIAPASWNDTVWDDINRMRTLNAEQRRRDMQMHVCPLQLDIIERLITRYSNEGDVVLDPFGGIGSTPMTAIKMGRYGIGIELNPDYFRDGVGYCKAEEDKIDVPTLFDFMDNTECPEFEEG